MGSIYLSPVESRIFGLKVGRADLDSFSEKDILNDIIGEEYDLCRIKIDAGNDGVIRQLESLGFPFYFSGALTRFKIDFRRHKVPPYRYNAEFELYDGSQYDQFVALLKQVFDEHPTTYYAVPFLNKMITEDQERDSLAVFFAEYYKTKDKKAWLVKLNGEYAGMIAAKFWDDKGDAVLAGVTPKYRNGGLFLDIIRFIQNYCVDNNVPWGYTGARFHEVVSQKFFSRESMSVFKTELIFHITCFLSKSVREPVVETLAIARNQGILPAILKTLNDHTKGFNIRKQRFHLFETQISGDIRLEATFPFVADNEQLIVTKLYTDRLIGVGYFEYEK